MTGAQWLWCSQLECGSKYSRDEFEFNQMLKIHSLNSNFIPALYCLSIKTLYCKQYIVRVGDTNLPTQLMKRLLISCGIHLRKSTNLGTVAAGQLITACIQRKSTGAQKINYCEL